MNIFRPTLLLLFAGLLAPAGCRYVDTTPMATGDQVLKGAITCPPDLTLPADASITVWLLDTANNDIPVGNQTIKNPGTSPIPFEIDYTASDIQLPHHVRIEARIEYGGKLRLMSGRNHQVTPTNANESFALTVSPLSGAGP
jgi:uncharacterized lipoprotein YbaY